MGDILPLRKGPSNLDTLIALIACELEAYRADLDHPGLNSLQLTVHFHAKTRRPATILYRPEFKHEVPAAYRTPSA